MKNHFQPFLLLILVVASLPALKGYRRTLQAIAPAPSPYTNTAPGSSPAPAPAPAPAPSPTSPPPLRTAVPVSSPPVLPPPAGDGGNVVSRDSGGGSSGLSGLQKARIVIGVLACAGVIGFAAMVYMKRRSNIQRARFGVLARRSQF